MKKVFRILGIIILAPLCVYWVYLGGFNIVEYFKGNTYVAYLNNNKTTLNTNFELDASFYEKQFYMVGEIHGFAKSPEIDFELFKHLNQKTGVRYYMSEVDYSQAYFLNEYLETGNDSTLHRALENWLVIQARNNKDYYEKWQKLYNYNISLRKNEKIVVLGCDVVSDMELYRAHLRLVLEPSDYIAIFGDAHKREELVVKIQTFKSDASKELALQKKYGSSFFDIDHLMETLMQTEERGREAKIFTNFKKLVDQFNLKDERIYSFYGNFHALQASTSDGFEPFAAKLKQSELNMGSNMVSLNMCFQDSKMIMPSEGLPDVLKTGPKWSEVGFKYDSLLLFYLEGIKDLIRTSEANTTPFIK